MLYITYPTLWAVAIYRGGVYKMNAASFISVPEAVRGTLMPRRVRQEFLRVIKWLSGCVDCGTRSDVYSRNLHFDHCGLGLGKNFDPTTPPFESCTVGALLDELARTEVRCSACHGHVSGRKKTSARLAGV